MKSKQGFALGIGAALAIAALSAPAAAQESSTDKIKRLESELEAARQARVVELQAELAQLAAPAAAPVPPPVAQPVSPPVRYVMTPAAAPEGETTGQRVTRLKGQLAGAVDGSAVAAVPGGPPAGFAVTDATAGQGAAIAMTALDLGEAKAEDEKEKDASKDFLNLGLGAGLSFTLGLGGRDRVTAAVLDPNGIVRVSDEDNAIARVMLEAHQFFGIGRSEAAADGTKKYRMGVGPFVAIQPGDGEVIDAIGGGLMFGFRPDIKAAKSFNLGIGVVVDPNTQVLGEGILADQPLPTGETEIRYRKTARYGLLLLTSFGF